MDTFTIDNAPWQILNSNWYLLMMLRHHPQVVMLSDTSLSSVHTICSCAFFSLDGFSMHE